MGFFKKKKEVMDLRKRSESITLAKKTSNTSTAVIEPSENKDSGFASGFDFFGNPLASSKNSSTSLSSNSNSSSYNSSTNYGDVERLKSRLDDLFHKFSQITDRLELLEKKIDRLERKN